MHINVFLNAVQYVVYLITVLRNKRTFFYSLILSKGLESKSKHYRDRVYLKLQTRKSMTDFFSSCICNSYVYPFFVWVKNILHKKEYYLDPPTDCFDQLVVVAT